MGLEMVKFLKADKCPLLNNILKKDNKEQNYGIYLFNKRIKNKRKVRIEPSWGS